MRQSAQQHSYLGLTLLLAALSATMPFAIDTYLPAMEQIAADLSVSLHEAELSISTYLLGCVPGTLIGGPLSDRFGRRIIGLSGLFLYATSACAIAFTSDYHALLALRFMQAFGAGFATVICSAVVRDLYEREEAAKVFALIGFMMMAAPLVAPLIGALILTVTTWEAVFFFLSAYAAIVYVLLAIYLPKTRQLAKNQPTPQQLSLKNVLIDYRNVLKNQTAFGYLLVQIFGGAVLFTFLTQAAFLIIEYWGFTAQEFPLFFSGCMLGLAICNRINAHMLKRHDSRTLLKVGLYIQWAAITLFLLSALLLPTIWIMLPMLFIFISMLGFIFSNSIANYLHFFPEKSGTANALTSALRYFMGGMIGASSSLLHTGSAVPMALLIFLCSGLAILGIQIAKRTTTE